MPLGQEDLERHGACTYALFDLRSGCARALDVRAFEARVRKKLWYGGGTEQDTNTSAERKDLHSCSTAS